MQEHIMKIRTDESEAKIKIAGKNQQLQASVSF